jgi:Putative protein-S-isoprenylcysteine methyltransferase
MDVYIIFGVLSVLLVLVSWRTLFKVRSHGFYRFFCWECMAWILANSYRYWYNDPFSIEQVISWLFLFASIYLVVAGAVQMKRKGKPDGRNEAALYKFEKTTELVATGIFKYIRHPLYSSLLFLTWGIFLKRITVELLVVALLSSLFLYLTAVAEEKECISYFGDKYKDYMKRSKRFIPFVL